MWLAVQCKLYCPILYFIVQCIHDTALHCAESQLQWMVREVHGIALMIQNCISLYCAGFSATVDGQETITEKLAACGIRAGIVLVILVILLVILVMFFCHRGHPFVILVLFFAILVILANLNCHPGHFLYLREAFHFFYLDQVTFFLYVHPLAPSSGSGTLLWSLQER